MFVWLLEGCQDHMNSDGSKSAVAFDRDAEFPSILFIFDMNEVYWEQPMPML